MKVSIGFAEWIRGTGPSDYAKLRTGFGMICVACEKDIQCNPYGYYKVSTYTHEKHWKMEGYMCRACMRAHSEGTL